MFYALLVRPLALFLVGQLLYQAAVSLPVALARLIGFLLIAPHSCLAGAISLDLDGKQRGVTIWGILGGVSYLGGILAGDGVTHISMAQCGKALSANSPLPSGCLVSPHCFTAARFGQKFAPMPMASSHLEHPTSSVS